MTEPRLSPMRRVRDAAAACVREPWSQSAYCDVADAVDAARFKWDGPWTPGPEGIRKVRRGTLLGHRVELRYSAPNGFYVVSVFVDTPLLRQYMQQWGISGGAVKARKVAITCARREVAKRIIKRCVAEAEAARC